MKCPKCGKEIVNDSAFCEYCGEPIKENRKYAIRRTDVRWVLLIATVIASWGLYISFLSREIFRWDDWKETNVTFVLCFVPLIVALVYGIRKLVPWSFVIVMAIWAFMNCGMCVSAAKGAYLYEELIVSVPYHPVNNDDNWDYFELRSERSQYVRSEYDEKIPVEKFGEIEKYAEMIAADLRKQGNAVSLNRDFERNYYPDYGSVDWLIGEFVVLFVYLIYAFIAYKKKWTF